MESVSLTQDEAKHEKKFITWTQPNTVVMGHHKQSNHITTDWHAFGKVNSNDPLTTCNITDKISNEPLQSQEHEVINQSYESDNIIINEQLVPGHTTIIIEEDKGEDHVSTMSQSDLMIKNQPTAISLPKSPQIDINHETSISPDEDYHCVPSIVKENTSSELKKEHNLTVPFKEYEMTISNELICSNDQLNEQLEHCIKPTLIEEYNLQEMTTSALNSQKTKQLGTTQPTLIEEYNLAIPHKKYEIDNNDIHVDSISNNQTDKELEQYNTTTTTKLTISAPSCYVPFTVEEREKEILLLVEEDDIILSQENLMSFELVTDNNNGYENKSKEKITKENNQERSEETGEKESKKDEKIRTQENTTVSIEHENETEDTLEREDKNKKGDKQEEIKNDNKNENKEDMCIPEINKDTEAQDFNVSEMKVSDKHNKINSACPDNIIRLECLKSFTPTLEIPLPSVFSFQAPLPPLTKSQLIRTLNKDLPSTLTNSVQYKTPPQWYSSISPPPNKRLKSLIEEEMLVNNGYDTVIQPLPIEQAAIGHSPHHNNTNYHTRNDDIIDMEESFVIPIEQTVERSSHDKNTNTCTYSKVNYYSEINDDINDTKEESLNINAATEGSLVVPDTETILSNDQDCSMDSRVSVGTMTTAQYYPKLVESRDTPSYKPVLKKGVITELVEPSQFNLARPKLRLGLSKKNTCRSLHFKN